jgi:nicotinamide mononucleotide adenylyltransferase
VQRVADRCRAIIVGLTNPDPELILEEGTSGHRHLSESNPFTFFERLRMICETLLDCNLSPERVIIIPFPINFHDRWR